MAEQADLSAAKDKLKKLIGKDIEAAYKITDKSDRSNALNEARSKAKEAPASIFYHLVCALTAYLAIKHV